MSAELKDFRGKITVEAYCQLEAEHRISGADQSAIVRDILHEWAIQKIRTATITDSLLRSEGLPGIKRESEGTSGNRGEDERK